MEQQLRSKKKNRKYSSELLSGGESFKASAACFRALWQMGREAESYLNMLSARSTEDNGRSNPNEFKSFWRQLFSVKLQKGNARVIYRKLEELFSFEIK